MSNEIQIAQQELIEDFELFEDWMDRYQYLIDMGRRLPEFPEALRTDENRIRGCQSQVWFVAKEQDGRLYFEACCCGCTTAVCRRTFSTRLRILSRHCNWRLT